MNDDIVNKFKNLKDNFKNMRHDQKKEYIENSIDKIQQNNKTEIFNIIKDILLNKDK